MSLVNQDLRNPAAVLKWYINGKRGCSWIGNFLSNHRSCEWPTNILIRAVVHGEAERFVSRWSHHIEVYRDCITNVFDVQ
ncbi:hypothetical protein CEXT_12871 [Caerostris extrusa]|uniref:Uncharacterized protein n=1 Tax=Caerostris extrusa TaxID=172846 RepID=A0AAV4XEH2_CAEEX|nr:hypothetical protein CEXT_12871 [Caerostris extrusa]